jgi:nucleoside-diphosphate-sugar epimerase
MRVFVTGATGFIGSAIVHELISAGHQVVGLARSDAAAKSLRDSGAEVHRGDLEELDSLRTGAAASDGVIHAGFIHDFSRFGESCETDARAIEAFGSALADSNRPLIVTSGIAVISPGSLATEDTPAPPPGTIPRASEQAAKSVAARGVRVSVVRLPPTVHGQGDHGFVPLLINLAREKGVSAYVDDGLNRWPAVHRFDVAKLYRLALEKASVGAVYHGIAEEGIAFQKISEAIGKGLGVPAVSKSPEEAAEHFGWFTAFAGIDCPASSKLTQDRLDWRPLHPSLLTDLGGDSGYFG